MVNNSVTGKVGDTFTVTVPKGADCFLSISPAGAVTWTVVGGDSTSVYANGTATVTIRASGTSTFVAQQDGAGRTITINATGAAQTITFNPQTANPSTYSPGGSFTISPVATASSGLAVAYTAGPSAVCTMGAGTTVNIVGAGTCTITASQPGNGNWDAATPVSQDVKINPAPQTITFNPQTANPSTYSPGGSFTIGPVATASSGLAVAYTAGPSAVCAMGAGTTVNMAGPGTCTITASQPGNGNWSAATPVSRDVKINPAPQTITFNPQTANPSTYSPGGSFTIGPVATASSGLAVAYTAGPSAVCAMGAGTTVNMAGPGTCTITASQPGNGNWSAATPVSQDVKINPVNPTPQTITFNPQTANPSTYSPGGSFTIGPVATASSGLAVAYAVAPNTVCTLVGTGPTVNIVGAGTCTITATQPGNGNWSAATPVSQDVKINQAPQTLTFPQQNPNKRAFAAGTTFSIAPLASTSTPDSGNPVVYTSRTPAVCGVVGSTVTMLQAGTCTLVATQAATGNFLAGEATQDVVLVAPYVAPTPVPTLGEWSLMLLGLLAAGLGVHGLRQRAQA